MSLRAHTPGHATNHFCYLLEEERILFTGDHIMQGSTVGDRDVRALARKFNSDLLADTACRTGNECDLALES